MAGELVRVDDLSLVLFECRSLETLLSCETVALDAEAAEAAEPTDEAGPPLPAPFAPFSPSRPHNTHVRSNVLRD